MSTRKRKSPRKRSPIPVRHWPDNSAPFGLIHDLERYGYRPDSNAQLTHLLMMPEDDLRIASTVLTYLLTSAGLLERLLEVTIAVLDTRAGDVDREEDDIDDDSANDREQDDSDKEPDDDREPDDEAEDDDPLEPNNAQGWHSDRNVELTPLPVLVGRTGK